MKLEAKELALTYVSACGRKDLDTVAGLLDPNVRFDGPGNRLTGAQAYLTVLRRLGPVWQSSDVRHAFVDGKHVCVIYDFVTNTSAGSIPIVEWLQIEAGKIASITLIFDRVAFKPASEELARQH